MRFAAEDIRSNRTCNMDATKRMFAKGYDARWKGVPYDPRWTNETFGPYPQYVNATHPEEGYYLIVPEEDLRPA